MQRSVAQLRNLRSPFTEFAGWDCADQFRRAPDLDKITVNWIVYDR